MSHYIGEIFEDEYPFSAAVFVTEESNNGNSCSIVEIEPTESGVRRYQITQILNPVPSPAEIREKEIRARLTELQKYLDDTDWYSARYVDNGTPIPEEIKQERQSAREEIERLREELEPDEPAAEEGKDEILANNSEDENAVIEPMAEDKILANNSEDEADDDTHNSED